MKKKLSLLIFCFVLFALVAPAGTPVVVTSIYGINVNAYEGIKIKLVLAGKSYDLITYNLIYAASDKSKPNIELANTYPMYNNVNLLSVTVKSNKIDQELMDWILSADNNTKDGQLLIIDDELGKTLKTITFKELKASSYNENFYNNGLNGNIQPTTTFTLHFTKLSIKL